MNSIAENGYRVSSPGVLLRSTPSSTQYSKRLKRIEDRIAVLETRNQELMAIIDSLVTCLSQGSALQDSDVIDNSRAR